MDKIVDMSAEAVTNRMLALDSLWELSVALKSSRIVNEGSKELKSKELSGESEEGDEK